MLMKHFIFLLFPLFLFGNNNCGEKPLKPKKKTYQSDFNFKSSLKYRSWKKNLLEWNECIKNNNLSNDSIFFVKVYFPNISRYNNEYYCFESDSVLYWIETYSNDSNLIECNDFLLEVNLSNPYPRLFQNHERHKFRYDSLRRLIGYTYYNVGNWELFDSSNIYCRFLNNNSVNFDSSNFYLEKKKEIQYIYYDNTSQVEINVFKKDKLVDFLIWNQSEWSGPYISNLGLSVVVPRNIKENYILNFDTINDHIYNSLRDSDALYTYKNDAYIDLSINYAIYKKDYFLNSLYQILKNQLCENQFDSLRTIQRKWLKQKNATILPYDKLILYEDRLDELAFDFSHYFRYSKKDSLVCFDKIYKIYGKQKRFSDILKEYKKKRNVYKNFFSNSIYDEALKYIDNKEYTIALDYLDSISIIFPDCANVFFDKGVVYSEISKIKQNQVEFFNWIEKGIMNYSKSISLDKNNLKAYFNRGVMYSSISNYNKAILDFSEVISIDPFFDNAYDYRGNQYFKLSQYDKAFNDFRKACSLGNIKSCKKYMSKSKNYKKNYLLKVLQIFLLFLSIYLIHKISKKFI